MELYFKKQYKEHPANILRKLGFFRIFDRRSQKESYVKRLSGTAHYPRFHVYIKKQQLGLIHLNIHLDMKKVSYEGSNAHSGEYDTDEVREEAKAIALAFKAAEIDSNTSTVMAAEKKGFFRRIFG